MKLKLLMILVVVTAVLPLARPERIDPEPWMFAFNEAAARKMAIGKEIIFTFGPFAGLYTESYHPNLQSLNLAAGVFLAAAVIASLRPHWGWVLLFAGGILSREGLFGSIPFLIGLAYYRSGNIWIMAALGLLPLIKGSYLISSVATAGLIALWLIYQRRYRMAATGLAIAVISNLGFWLVAGQKLSDLADYYRSMLPMIGGFASAMALYSRSWEVVLYLLVAGAILWQMVKSKLLVSDKIYLLALTGLHLLTNFKTGFVRHDVHVLNAATALFIGVTGLALTLKQQHFKYVVVGTVLAGLLISEKQVPSLLPYLNPLNRLINKTAVTQPLVNLPIFPGSSDIYSVDQTALILSGNQWNPRPVFQSYSAYNPELLRLNRDHLLNRPPDNLFVKVEPIDGRLPALEEGVSWPVMLTNYTYRSTTQTHVILSRTNQAIVEPKLGPISEVSANLGDIVSLPDAKGRVYAKLTIEPTGLGKLVSLAYKPQELRIVMGLADGKQVNYRIIPSMTQTEFLLSPLVENTDDFGALFSNSNSKQVTWFKIMPAASFNYSWQTDFGVEFLSEN